MGEEARRRALSTYYRFESCKKSALVKGQLNVVGKWNMSVERGPCWGGDDAVVLGSGISQAADLRGQIAAIKNINWGESASTRLQEHYGAH